MQKPSRSQDDAAKRARPKAVSKATPKKKATKKKATPKKKAAKKKATPKKKATKKKSQSPPAAFQPPAEPCELTGPVARTVWRESEPKLRDRLNLLDIDHRILILYCNCWQLLTDCQQVLAKEGRYVTMEDTGYVSRHPAAVDEKNTIAQIRQLAAELGMTPKAGKRVTVRSGDGDALMAFLNQRPE